MSLNRITLVSMLIAVALALNAHAATVGLTPVIGNGDKMVSDSVLDVTWADVIPANDVTYYTDRYGINYKLPTNEILQYAGSAQEWIANLNSTNYGGHNDWRLPTGDGGVSPSITSCSSGTTNEIGCLFKNELDNVGIWVPVSNYGPFTSFYGGWSFWSSTDSPPDPNAWKFYTGTMVQEAIGYGNTIKALAVRTGQTLDAPPPVTPIPATAWLLISSIGGLGVFARKRKA